MTRFLHFCVLTYLRSYELWPRFFTIFSFLIKLLNLLLLLFRGKDTKNKQVRKIICMTGKWQYFMLRHLEEEKTAFKMNFLSTILGQRIDLENHHDLKKENDHLSKIFFQLFLLHVWAEQKCTFLLKKDMTRIRFCSFRHQEFQARFLLLVHIILYLPALCCYVLLMPYWSRNLCQSWLIHSLRKSALFTVVHTSISNALTCPVSTTFCFALWTINYKSTSVQSQ